MLFPNKNVDAAHFGTMPSNNHIEINYGFVYIAHPRAVTHLSWRKTSKYMPKGSVSNMLITSCLDNICRIWIETVLPDDGLVNMNQFDPLATQNPKFRTHRHKHRFMQRLKHMKTCFHIRRHAKHHNGNTHHIGQTVGSVYGSVLGNGNFGQSPIPSLPSTYSVHDFHSYGYHGTGVTPGLHFHLAASINAETDIPLVPSMQSNDPSNQPNFILHWLNNKEMHFTMQAEAILQDLTRKVIEKEQMNNVSSGTSEHNSDGHDGHDEHPPNPPTQNHQSAAADEPKKRFGKNQKSFSHDESNSDDHLAHSTKSAGASQAGLHSHHSLSNTTSLNSLATDHGGAAPNVPVTDSLDMKIECLLRDWHHSPDLVFSIHPIDGSYLIWVVEWLDEYHPGAFRQAQISFSTRIPSGFPLGDAMSMSTSVNLYNTGGNLLHFREMVKGVPSSVVSQAAANTDQNQGEVTTPLPSVLEETEEQAQQEEARKSVSKNLAQTQNASGDGSEEEQPPDILTAPPSPTISMVTKHANGTLNLWQLTFADKSKFTQVSVH